MELIVKRFEELSLEELYEIIKVRLEVFVVEQNCVYQDIDDKDKKAYHVYLKDDNEIKAYLRVLDKGVSFDDVAFGRVLTTERGKGYSTIILQEAIKITKEKLHANKVIIEAQVYAKGMYEKHRFRQVSDEFLEDGIPHIKMELNL